MRQSDPRLEIVRRLLANGPTRSWTVSELASSVDLSVSHFRRLFVLEFGVPPKQYLKHLQLKEAARRLTCSTQAVKAIMRDVGFSDPSHFTRDFTRQFGLSPVSYRKRVLGTRIAHAKRPTES